MQIKTIKNKDDGRGNDLKGEYMKETELKLYVWEDNGDGE